MVEEYIVKVYDDRTKWLNMEGELHRLDGPAIEYSNGHKEWCVNGQLHRIDGPAIEWSDGTKHWWVNGQRHRVDGPAVECSNGTKSWWINGQLHRLDGPAIERSDGTKSWWIEGKQLTEEEFNQLVNPIQELSVEEISNRLGYEVKIVKS